MFKLLLAAAIAAVPVNVSPTIPPSVTAAPQIPRVGCIVSPTMASMGTAFRIGPHLLLSVRHVTDEPRCYIDGRPITVAWNSPTADFSILTDSREGPYLKVDCGGFVKGRKYLAIGHARGLAELTVVELTGTGVVKDGVAVLSGIWTVIPGQSGGPIIDAETRRVVGTVNFYDMAHGLSGSVELRGTPVCSKS